MIVHTRADQLLSQLLIEHFDTLPTQCRHIEHMHEGVWFPKSISDKMAAMRTLTFFPACFNKKGLCLLAHLSRRLTGELIGYPWIRLPSSSVRSSVHIFKHLLLRNRLANQSQILCGASLGRGNESLYKWSRSHDQDGRHAHIW